MSTHDFPIAFRVATYLLDVHGRTYASLRNSKTGCQCQTSVMPFPSLRTLALPRTERASTRRSPLGNIEKG
jgi:hypothetical protein